MNIKTIFHKTFSSFLSQPLWIKLLILFFSICLAVATRNHIMDIVHGGFLPYEKHPMALRLYWTSLTLFDPLAIVLFYLSLPKGLYLVVAIMVSDVVINFYATYTFWNSSFSQNTSFQMQLFFGIVVVITVPFILKYMKRES